MNLISIFRHFIVDISLRLACWLAASCLLPPLIRHHHVHQRPPPSPSRQRAHGAPFDRFKPNSPTMMSLPTNWQHLSRIYVTLISILSLTHTLSAHDQVTDACTRPWPQLELWLPLGLRVAQGKQNKGIRRRNREFGYWFFRSFFLFWPIETSKVTLRLVLDEEIGPAMPKGNLTSLYHDAMQLLSVYVDKRRKYIPTFDLSSLLNVTYGPISSIYKSGYDRQQWMMFWADNFSTSEYIGFVDSDTLFTTYIDLEDLFEQGKPVVNGRLGFINRKGDAWAVVPASTRNFTGDIISLSPHLLRFC